MSQIDLLIPMPADTLEAGDKRTVACPDCDLLNRLDQGCHLTQVCGRCGAVLQRYRPNSVDRSLALTIAALILLGISNFFPFLAMRSGGFFQETTLTTGVIELWVQKEYGLAVLIAFTCIGAPLMQIFGLLYILTPLRIGRKPLPGAAGLLRTTYHLAPWAMMEVFMIGILVALVKLSHMATIIPGISVLSFALLIFVMPAALSSLDLPLLWDKLDLRR